MEGPPGPLQQADDSGDPADDGADGEVGAGAEKPRHRQNFTWRQLAVLEQVFDQDPLPKMVRARRARRHHWAGSTPFPSHPSPLTRVALRSQTVRNQLADKLGVTPRCIQVWFQNRRQKWKTIQKTRGVTVPALKSVSARLESLDQLFPGLWNAVRPCAAPVGQPRATCPPRCMHCSCAPRGDVALTRSDAFGVCRVRSTAAGWHPGGSKQPSFRAPAAARRVVARRVVARRPRAGARRALRRWPAPSRWGSRWA